MATFDALTNLNEQYSSPYRYQTSVQRITLRNRKPFEQLLAGRLENPAPVFRSFSLYRMWDAEGTLLYIGLSSGVKRRLDSPAHYAAWRSQVARIEIEPLPAGSPGFSIEKAAIKAEHPKYNVYRGDKTRDRLDSADKPPTASRYEQQMAEIARLAREFGVATVAKRAGLRPREVRHALAGGRSKLLTKLKLSIAVTPKRAA